MKSPIEKRDRAKPPQVELLRESKGANYPPGRMLVASPLAVQAIVERIPKGQTLSMSDLRRQLAQAHAADYACALTTGIFLRIVAEAAEEERAQGRRRLAPYWRVVRDEGKLIDKLPGGVEAQAEKLTTEGVAIEWKRGVPRIAGRSTRR